MLKRMFSKSSLRKQRERPKSQGDISTSERSESELMTTEQESSMGLCLSSADLPVADVSATDRPVAMPEETNPPPTINTLKPPGSPGTVSCVKSVGTPTTVDLSWGGESSDSTTHVEVVDAEEQQMQQSDVPIKGKREQSKMERIKAKAIKSATKELGLDEKMLADVLGLNSSPELEGKKSSIKARGKLVAEVSDPQEISQMRYLAKTLGLPPSFFGIPADNEQDPKPSSSSSSLEKDQQAQENFPPQPETISERSSLEGSARTDVDLENSAELTSSFRKATSKPLPSTDEERRQAKDDAVARLNRMKAKAIKSATKSLGVDENNLSAAVGVDLESYETTTATTQKKTEDSAPAENYNESPEEIQFIADTLGLPVELFGIQGNKQDKKSQTASSTAQPLPGSLAAALGMKIVETPETTVEQAGSNERGLGKTESSSASQGKAGSLNGHPQPGSLADALGMVVDDSEEAPPVRHVIYHSPSAVAAPERSNEVSDTQVDSSARSLPIEFSAPASGSLAAAFAALGLNFDPAPNPPQQQLQQITKPQSRSVADASGPVVRQSSSPKSKEQTLVKPREGSLADALGMQIDASSPVPQAVSKPRPGSLADALGMVVSPAPSIPHAEEVAKPQPGSLADALGMLIDTSPSVNQPHEPVRQIPPVKQQDAIAKPCPGSLADALGLSVSVSADVPQEKAVGKPRPGSLADALGMSVDTAPPGPDKVEVGRPRAGSLADALGMRVSTTPEVSRQDELSKPRAGSLADALGMSVSSKPTVSEQEISKPRPGSLADALGMSVSASPSDTQGQQQTSKPRAGGFADTVGMSSGPNVATHHEQEITKPQPGSLADALGMSVGHSRGLVPERNNTSNMAQTQGTSKPLSGSLADALGMSVSPTVPESQQVQQITQPRVGSLADALGMRVAPTGTATRERQINSTDVSLPKSTDRQVTKPLAGSLADALGFSVSSSPKVVEEQVVTRAQPGSLADALGMPVNSSPLIPSNEVKHGASIQNARAGSLAAALGMKIDNSDDTGNVRLEQPKQGSLAAALGMKVSAPEMNRTRIEQPRPGSLAAALGMSIDASVSAPIVRAPTDNVGVKPTSSANVQPGSLAAALGINVGSSNPKEQDRSIEPLASMDNHTTGPVAPGSLAAALGMPVGSVPSHTFVETSGQERYEQPKPGSLAEALGMKITPSRTFEEDNSDDETASEGSDSESGEEDDSHTPGRNSASQVTARSAPQPGTLAAALGMTVEPAAVSATPTQQSMAPFFTSEGKSTLFGRVFSTVVAKQAKSSSSSSQKGKKSSDGKSRGVQPESMVEALNVPVVENQRSVGAPQPGSLAAALGMSVSHERTPATQVATTVQPGSLAAALGAPVSKIATSSPPVLPGSLAAALGMTSSSLGPSPEPPTVVSRSQPAESANVESSDEFAKIYTMGPASETEVMLRVELASAKAEAAGAVAYGKALEKQIAQMSKAYVEKLAELQQQIASYQKEVAEKSRAIECLETEVVEEQQNYDMLLQRVDQTTDRLTRTQTMMDETDALLQQEFAELRELRSVLEQRLRAENGSSPTAAPAAGNGATRTSLVTRDLQRTLEREGDRRQSLKARLQSLRQAHSNVN